MKNPNHSLFIETNDVYLRLNGVVSIDKIEPNIIDVKTRMNVQASLILRGCIEYFNFYYKQHKFKFTTKGSVAVFEGRVVSVIENEYNNIFRIEINS